MKKNLFKILIPSITLVSAAMPLLASCQNPQEESEEEQKKHVHVADIPTPTKGSDYSLTFTLDDNYSLNMQDSKITFKTDSNETDLSLSQCSVDSETKTITVPGEHVTSNDKPTLNLVSEKQYKVDNIKDKKEMIRSFYFNDDDSKNVTYYGTIQAEFYDGTPTQIGEKTGYQTGNAQMYIRDGKTQFTQHYEIHSEQEQTVDRTTYVGRDDYDTGYWFIQPKNSSYVAFPAKKNTILLSCFGGDGFDQYFDFDEFVNKLKYDSIKNCYTGRISETAGGYYIDFSFYLTKDKNSIRSFEYEEILQSGSSMTLGKVSFTDGGQCQQEIYIPTYSNTTNYFSTFSYADGLWSSSKTGTQSGTSKYATIFTNEFEDYDKEKPVRLYYVYGEPGQAEYAKDKIFVAGVELIKDTDWTVKTSASGTEYIEINANIIDKNAQVVGYAYTTSSPTKIVFTQGDIE